MILMVSLGFELVYLGKRSAAAWIVARRKRLKQLEDENRKLKHVVVELTPPLVLLHMKTAVHRAFASASLSPGAITSSSTTD